MSKPVVFGSAYADRIGQVVRAVERQYPPETRNNRSVPRSPLFNADLGWVVEKGPDDEDDFTDHRYWVRRVRPRNTEPAFDDAMMLEEYPDEWFTHDIVPVTNAAEELTRGHLLWLNQPVVFYAGYDRGDPTQVRFWSMVPPPQPWMWVKIIASNPVGTNRWTYTGVRHGIDDNGEWAVGTGFYEREIEEIINPAEAFNNGTGHEGNSIFIAPGMPCELVPIRGEPIVAISPTLTKLDDSSGIGKVIWSVVAYPNSFDLRRL